MYRIEVFPSFDDDHGAGKVLWYWNARPRRGGKIVADSGEGYASRAYCKKQAKKVINWSLCVVRNRDGSVASWETR